LVELRHLIEPAAAGLAAARGGREKIASIGAALDAMRRSVDDLEAFNRADAEFHVAVFVASNNVLIDRLSTIMRPLLDVTFALQVSARAGNADIVDMHAAVYEAIVAGDVASARQGMERILSMATVEVEQAIGGTVNAVVIGGTLDTIR
jgi:DNA-binding FadR family transcriptional regulator